MALSAKALNRASRAVLAALVLAGIVRMPAEHRFARLAPFAPQPFPQRASGDFDGDGRPDVAVIRDGPGGSQMMVRLSGPSANVLFDASIVSIVAADIDHDGDLDLVAATPSGDLVVWINDGRGGFTPQDRAQHRPGLTPGAMFGDASQDALVAVGPTAPPVVLPPRSETAVAVTRARPPTVPASFSLSFLSSPTLRGPPTPVGLS